MEVLHRIQHMAVQIEEYVAAGILFAEGFVGQSFDASNFLGVSGFFCDPQQISADCIGVQLSAGAALLDDVLRLQRGEEVRDSNISFL